MQEVLRLAEKGRGNTSPNPMVGAVLVKDGRIVGKGYHQGFGKPHAEVEAIKDAGKKVKASILYVNLEPCSHYGKTPPCTDAIISAGIKKVVYSVKDPNPAVNGRGAAMLRRHGLEVKSGLLEQEARRLNEAYFKYRLTGLPLVTLLLQQTLNGHQINENLKRGKDIPGLDYANVNISASSQNPRFNNKRQAESYLRKFTQQGKLSLMMNEVKGLGGELLKYRLIDKVVCLIYPHLGSERLVIGIDLGVKKINQALELKQVEYKFVKDFVIVSGYLNQN